jgi:hypothetical protein
MRIQGIKLHSSLLGNGRLVGIETGYLRPAERSKF